MAARVLRDVENRLSQFVLFPGTGPPVPLRRSEFTEMMMFWRLGAKADFLSYPR